MLTSPQHWLRSSWRFPVSKSKSKKVDQKPTETRQLVLSVTLKDCEVQTFRAGGKGGQNQNKRDSGVRVIHPPSGARGEARDERSQAQNKKAAFTRMAQSKEFKTWVRKQAGEDARLIAEVERDLWPDRTKVEVKDPDGNWVQE